ncbi:hypothetical protein [Brevibacillus laterosporus]|uniref:hypothetical protein n=1 Tax=Brevibacillus laterosporus TaxID=1465 RepID=UPI001A7EADCA|nr:hypothetical protein [Brevibacillus laterosporus]
MAQTSSSRWNMKSVINSGMLILCMVEDNWELLTNPNGVRYNKIGRPQWMTFELRKGMKAYIESENSVTIVYL